MPDIFFDTFHTEISPVYCNNYIYRYHSPNRPPVSFYHNADEPDDGLYFGIEIEFDRYDRVPSRLNRTNLLDIISNTSVLCNNNDQYIYYMRDGSLHNGLEMITQPSTYDFYISKAAMFKEIFDIIKNHGYDSDKCLTCGFHIHFNRDYFLGHSHTDTEEERKNIEKLLTLVDKFWWPIVFCSRRRYTNLTRYARKYDKSPIQIVDDIWCGNLPDRYRAINFRNPSTIEFRLFSGTLDIDTFLATLELTKNIIETSRNSTLEEIKKMPWEYLLTSERLIKYYFDCEKRSKTRRYQKYINGAQCRG